MEIADGDFDGYLMDGGETAEVPAQVARFENRMGHAPSAPPL
jgi:hypothetical protein